MNQAFRHLDRRGAGAIYASEALRALRGEVNARRAHAIDEVFDHLLYDTEHGNRNSENDGETLEPSAIAQLFRAEAHPDVTLGAKEPRAFFSEFLEAFEGEGSLHLCFLEPLLSLLNHYFLQMAGRIMLDGCILLALR